MICPSTKTAVAGPSLAPRRHDANWAFKTQSTAIQKELARYELRPAAALAVPRSLRTQNDESTRSLESAMEPQLLDGLEKTLQAHGPGAAIDQLCDDLKARKEYAALFYTLLMKKRH